MVKEAGETVSASLNNREFHNPDVAGFFQAFVLRSSRFDD
jgi:hypothetical protein